MNRKQIIQEHVRQEDLFKVLRLAFHQMVRRELRLIDELGLTCPINANAFDNLARDMHYLQAHYRLVKK